MVWCMLTCGNGSLSVSTNSHIVSDHNNIWSYNSSHNLFHCTTLLSQSSGYHPTQRGVGTSLDIIGDICSMDSSDYFCPSPSYGSGDLLQ